MKKSIFSRIGIKSFYTSITAVFTVGAIIYSVVQIQSALGKPEQYISKTVTLIDFKGNLNVSDADLYDLIGIKVGDKLSLSAINAATKNIYNHGFFSDIHVEAKSYKDGVALYFIVIERPIVREVKFQGLSEINEQEMLEAVTVKEGEVYSDKKENESMQIILSRYQEEGLFNAIVKIRKEIIDEKLNSLRVVFLIDEGENVKISKINLIGVHSLDAEDIMSIMELEEEGFIDDGTFKEYIFEKDKTTIEDYYKTQGYLDASLEEARWDIRWKNPKKKDERVIVINYKVSEGDQYFYNGYDITWDDKFLNPYRKDKDNKPIPLFEMDKLEYYFEYTQGQIGDVFDYGKYMRDRGTINTMYSKEGYIFTRVIPERTTILLTKTDLDEKANSAIQKEKEKEGIDYYNIQKLRKILVKNPELEGRKFLHTRFVIAEGDKGYIENIIVKGNKKTMDKVIRRELLINEGELFNSAKVERSRQRVFNLGFFKNVNIDGRAGTTEGKINLIVDVEEQPTGSISLGGGYSTQTGFSIFTEVSENNLNGTGQRISGRVEFGPSRTAIETSWREPWIFDKPWSLTLSLFYMNSLIQTYSIDISDSDEMAYYESESVGFTVGIGHRLFVNWGHYHRFSPMISRSTNPSSMVSDSVYRRVALEWQLKNKFTNGIYYDNLDNAFNPTSGLYFDFHIDTVGGIFGGDDHYNRYDPMASFYWWVFDYTFFNMIRKNILRRWRVVLEHRVSMSFTHLTAPVWKDQDSEENPYLEDIDRLLIGGYESLRGWNLYDFYFPDAWRQGGSHRILYGSELRIPVEPSVFWLVLFFDAGALYTNPNEYQLDESVTSDFKKSVYDSRLSMRTMSMDYFRYSWGFGFRLQIPVLPIRIYMAKRLEWDSGRGWFRNHSKADNFEFVFGIGDRRF